MKKIHIILILIIVIAIGAIISTVYNAGTYSDFTEAAKHPGKTFQIIGVLNKEKGVLFDAKNNPDQISFYIRDEKGVEKKVIFNGTKPLDFEKSDKVVMTGKMENDVFVASSILLKCPSKFTKDKNSEEKEFKAKK